jgi:hypothetical protein
MRAMALFFHIVFAFLGLLASYVYSILFFLGAHAEYEWSRWLMLAALAGLVASGTALFAARPQVFLASGKFLSNMTILGFLVVIELSFFVWASPELRVASLCSWTWIFLAAVISPPLRYRTFMIGYAGVLAWMLSFAYFSLGA